MQYNFKKQKQTEDAPIHIKKKITQNNPYTRGIFLDFWKAFNTIQHNVLF